MLYSFEGHVEVGHAAVVGGPAAVGAVLGASLQQRVPVRTLSYAFAVLLTAVGVWLIAG